MGPRRIAIDLTSENMVLALSLLVACWVAISLIVGFVWLVGHSLDMLGLDFVLDSTLALVILVAKLLAQLTGWVLLLIAFLGSDSDVSLIDHVWGGQLLKALATVPAAGAAAVLTVTIVVMLPRSRSARGLWLRVGYVLACLILAVSTFGGLLFLTIELGIPPAHGSVPELVYALGFLPLLLVSGLFLMVTVALGFGASWTHPRAGGVRTVLFTVGLVATYLLLARYGPVAVPGGGEQLSAAIVEPKLGLSGVIAFLVAGVLGIVYPAATVEDTR